MPLLQEQWGTLLSDPVFASAKSDKLFRAVVKSMDRAVVKQAVEFPTTFPCCAAELLNITPTNLFSAVFSNLCHRLVHWPLVDDTPLPHNPPRVSASIFTSDLTIQSMSYDAYICPSVTPATLVILDPPMIGSKANPQFPAWRLDLIPQVLQKCLDSHQLVHSGAAISVILSSMYQCVDLWKLLDRLHRFPAKPVHIISFPDSMRHFWKHNLPTAYALIIKPTHNQSINVAELPVSIPVPGVPRQGSRYGRQELDGMVMSSAEGGEPVNDHQRPYDVSVSLIRMFTCPGETVLSLCCGTGTDLVAALANCRHAIGIDAALVQTASAAKRLTEFQTHQHKSRHERVTMNAVRHRMRREAKEEGRSQEDIDKNIPMEEDDATPVAAVEEAFTVEEAHLDEEGNVQKVMAMTEAMKKRIAILVDVLRKAGEPMNTASKTQALEELAKRWTIEAIDLVIASVQLVVDIKNTDDHELDGDEQHLKAKSELENLTTQIGKQARAIKDAAAKAAAPPAAGAIAGPSEAATAADTAMPEQT